MSWTRATAAAERRGATAPGAGGNWPEARSPSLGGLIGDLRHLSEPEPARAGELIAAE